jgi:hypothetical protein
MQQTIRNLEFQSASGVAAEPKTRWIKKAETIPWNTIEERYAELFPTNR